MPAQGPSVSVTMPFDVVVVFKLNGVVGVEQVPLVVMQVAVRLVMVVLDHPVLLPEVP